MLAPSFGATSVEVATETGTPEQIVPQVAGFGGKGDLLDLLLVYSAVNGVRGLLGAKCEAGVVDHPGSESHGGSLHA
jgi:hypothetical protein